MVRPGDILVAGENSGMGSGRPIGEVLRACGIVAVVAESINGLTMRNCVTSSPPARSVGDELNRYDCRNCAPASH